MLSKSESFWWGVFGSILPEVVRIYKLVTSNTELGELSITFVLAYIGISIVYMTAGGLFSMAWRPENPYKAIWLGVSFPVMVSAMLQQAPHLPNGG